MLLPFRETTLLLRYDLEDRFAVIDPPPACGGYGLATGQVLGKRSLSVRHRDGSWTTPRAVLSALEDLAELPLPARCGFWECDDGVDVEMLVPRARRGEKLAAATGARHRAGPGWRSAVPTP